MLTSPPVILLVDDDPETLELLRRLIDPFTRYAEIVAVASGAAALAVMAARPVALVLADYHMPEMNGIQLIGAIKAASPTTCVAIVSVDDRDDVTRRANAAGADCVLAKPFVLTELQQLIAERVPAGAGSP
jgi:two-component system, chemotaxis family, chemotaxis protein CheY